MPLLGAIGRRCWVPLLECRHAGLLLGAIAGCHCWGAIAGCHHACHCWVPLLGCHGWMLASAIARCHCWMPLRESHCWVPLREKIGQSDTPFSAASFSTLITHELACAIWGLCWYNSLDVSRDHIRPVFATGPQPPASAASVRGN